MISTLYFNIIQCTSDFPCLYKSKVSIYLYIPLCLVTGTGSPSILSTKHVKRDYITSVKIVNTENLRKIVLNFL